ncbi:unnamed protein product [Cladocopium goreaui]|uniref:Calcium-binding protein 8 n=1 Tax=Cladocopium goreaui TaxID=2562237 RepID=A0A9P1FQK0_9DINO|nr:unnamed protein product [Cladocopium goreaui]
MTMILSESAEANFKHALSYDYLQEVRAGLGGLDVRGAKATSTADEDLIKRLILNSIGFDKLNQTVRARLVERLMGIVGEAMGN